MGTVPSTAGLNIKKRDCSLLGLGYPSFSYPCTWVLLLFRPLDSDQDLDHWFLWFTSIWVWTGITPAFLDLQVEDRRQGLLCLHNHVRQPFIINPSLSIYPVNLFLWRTLTNAASMMLLLQLFSGMSLPRNKSMVL